MRILVVSHGHPKFSKGGAEIAAYRLFNGYKNIPQNKVWFMGRCDDSMLHPGTRINALSENEFIFSGHADAVNMSSSIDLSVDGEFVQFLKHLNPDIIHFHHYINIGVEVFFAVKRVLPKCKVILTLHEYIAICMHNGQMIKTDKSLCYESSPRACNQCFPSTTPENFFLREQYAKRFFNEVDCFISPSNFLKSRYASWGLDQNKIYVIENPQEVKFISNTDQNTSQANVFGFFGQINPYKGLHIVLEAIQQMTDAERKQFILEIHGANLEIQEPEFQEKIHALLEPLINNGCVQLIGAYEPHELEKRMLNVDWVIVPSIWWENSPMVIQEAFCYEKPVILSDIGGMSEKVIHEINGLHVPVSNVSAWKKALLKCAGNSEMLKKYRSNIVLPKNEIEIAHMHLSLFSNL